MDDEESLCLHELPFYEKELSTALDKLDQLKSLVEKQKEPENLIIIKIQEPSGRTYQMLADIKDDHSYCSSMMDVIQKTQQLELKEVTMENYELDYEIMEHNTLIDQLQEQYNQLTLQNQAKKQALDETYFKYQEKKMVLDSLREQIQDQELFNIQSQHQINILSRKIQIEQNQFIRQ